MRGHMAGKLRQTSRKALVKLRGGQAGKSAQDETPAVPGPTESSTGNAVFIGVAMRMGAFLVGRMLERHMLANRVHGVGAADGANFGQVGEPAKGQQGQPAKSARKKAAKPAKKRKLSATVASMALAKIGTRSLPGAAVVTGAMATKLLLDRRKARRLMQTSLSRANRAAARPRDKRIGPGTRP